MRQDQYIMETEVDLIGEGLSWEVPDIELHQDNQDMIDSDQGQRIVIDRNQRKHLREILLHL